MTARFTVGEIFEALPDYGKNGLTRREISDRIQMTVNQVSNGLFALGKKRKVLNVEGRWTRAKDATPPDAKGASRVSRSSSLGSIEKYMARGDAIMTSLLEWKEEGRSMMVTPQERQELIELRDYRDKMDEQLRNLAPPKMRRKS